MCEPMGENIVTEYAKTSTLPELPQQRSCKEEEVLTDWQLGDQERKSSLHREDPEPPQIKEEQVEVCIKQEEEEFVLKQETDVVTHRYDENGRSEGINREPSPSHFQHMPLNEGFTKGQTLYFINMIRQHLEAGGCGLPKTLEDLNERLRLGRKSKKQLWVEIALKLGSHFNETFCPEKVSRKWGTLMEAYKKVKDNHIEKPRMRFQFYNEMNGLLGVQPDVALPFVGPSPMLVLRRPEALGQCSNQDVSLETMSCMSSSSTPLETPPTPTPRPLKRQRDADLLQFFRDSEAARERRHKETLAQLKATQQSFEFLMSCILDKLSAQDQ